MKKKIFVLTLALLVALAVPTLAALKMLPEPLALELEGIAKEHLAQARNTSADKLSVSEAWVRELWNIEKEIYIVVFDINEEKVSVYVDVAEKAVVSDADFEALVAEDLAKAPEEPVFRTMSLEVDADGEVTATQTEKAASKVPFIVGAVVVGLGAGAFLLKSRLN